MRTLLLVPALVVALAAPATAHAAYSPTLWIGTSCPGAVVHDPAVGSLALYVQPWGGVPCYVDSIPWYVWFPPGSCADVERGWLHCESDDPLAPGWRETLDINGGGFVARDGPYEASGWLMQVA